MTEQTVTLRSRHPRYRWRGVQFENHMASVTPAQAEAAQRDPFFGVGRDFWIDAPPAAGGGKNNAPAPTDEQLAEARAELGKLRRADLIEIAAERGVDLADGDTKDQIIDKLVNHEAAPAAA